MNLKTLGIFIAVTFGILLGAGLLLFQFGNASVDTIADVAGEYRHVIEPDIADKQNLVTVVEFSDFQCPACRAVQQPLKETLAKYEGKVRFVYRHFPLVSIHKNAQISAQAAEAAHLQGKFWQMHDKLFETQQAWAESGDPVSVFVNYAKELGMDQAKFESDINSDAIKDVVSIDSSYASRVRLSGTPTFFVNGTQVEFGKLDGKLAELVK